MCINVIPTKLMAKSASAVLWSVSEVIVIIIDIALITHITRQYNKNDTYNDVALT